MAEYIDRQAAIGLLSEPITMSMCLSTDECHHKIAQRRIDRYLIENIPAADVWEVVHCADCAHAEESLVSGCVYCNEMERARIKEGFCAWGERKTKDG